MSKIRSIRKVRCKETWSRYPKEFEFVQLFVAEMIDGTRFYTTKGGAQIFGTEEELNGETDISNVHDFQTISVAGGVKDEEQFRKIVESEAVINQLV